MTRRSPCIVIATLCCLLSVSAEEAAAITGNEFRRLPDLARMMYAVATIDAWGNVSALIRGKKLSATAVDVVYGDISRCVVGRGMINEQVLAIVDKYLKENPEKWDADMTSLIWNAFVAVCK